MHYYFTVILNLNFYSCRKTKCQKCTYILTLIIPLNFPKIRMFPITANNCLFILIEKKLICDFNRLHTTRWSLRSYHTRFEVETSLLIIPGLYGDFQLFHDWNSFYLVTQVINYSNMIILVNNYF